MKIVMSVGTRKVVFRYLMISMSSVVSFIWVNNAMFLLCSRGKRLFAKQRLTHLLSVEGIDSDKLMPRIYPADHKVQLNKSPDPAPFPPFLPLEIFDNKEYDCRTPAEWLALGYESDSNVRKPVPAKALLPADDKCNKGLFSRTFRVVFGLYTRTKWLQIRSVIGRFFVVQGAGSNFKKCFGLDFEKHDLRPILLYGFETTLIMLAGWSFCPRIWSFGAFEMCF